MKKYSIGVFALLSLITQPINAQNSSDNDTETEIVVTATRTAQTADDTLASVTVFTREDIERSQAQSIQDLLRGTAGLSISNSGGQGKLTTLFLRGTESDHLLVLIDGIRVGSAAVGLTPLQHLSLDQIERIELVRGPNSSLYGSDAIGGVLQIFTRKGKGKLHSSVSLEAGSYNTRKATTNVAFGNKRSHFNFGISRIESDGFNSCRGNVAAGCFTIEPDKDGYERISGSLQAGYRFGNEVEVGFNWLRGKSSSEFDGGFQNESDDNQEILGAKVSFSPASFWHSSLLLGRSIDENKNYKDSVFASQFDTTRDSISFQNDFQLGKNNLLTLGADYLNDEIKSSEAFAVTSRNNIGVFQQYQGQLNQHRLQFSLREDDNEQFGTHTTGSAAWSYRFANKLRLSASYGTAFKAPSFNELYFPFFGNANLTPEESRTAELGLFKNSPWGTWSLNLYQTRVDDLIGFDPVTFASVNINEARILGFEGNLKQKFGNWAFNTTLSLLDPENRSPDSNNGNDLPRRARQSLHTELDLKLGKLKLGASLHISGSRYDDPANTRKLDAYARLDARTEYSFTKAWRVRARIENVSDKDYETAAFYNQPGRSFYMILLYQR